MLQVLVSISSHIFNEMPFRNEPAFETASVENCQVYNCFVRAITAKVAILDAIPDGRPRSQTGFEDVIATHLLLKRTAVVAMLKRWHALDPHHVGFSARAFAVHMRQPHGVQVATGINAVRDWTYPMLIQTIEARLDRLALPKP